MSSKLSLSRDFTRFQNDETFPHKVTVCIGENRHICSGAILAQQSSVLERKFREDSGVLMLEEMLDIGKHDQVIQCFNYLHGGDLEFTYENIEVTIKFASWYEIDNLFDQALIWIEDLLYKHKHIEELLYFLKFAASLNPVNYNKLKSAIKSFIEVNIDYVSEHILNYLHLGISGFNLITILNHSPRLNANQMLVKWTALCLENRNFILKNPKLFNFNKLFPEARDFGSFSSALSVGPESVDRMKVIIDIQRDYLLRSDKCDETAGGSGTVVGTSSDTCSIQNICSVEPVTVNTTESLNSVQTQHQLIQSGDAGEHIDDRAEYYDSGQEYSGNSDSGEEYEYDSTEVYIGNVPPSASKRQLIQLFKFAGWINKVTFDKSDDSAVIHFKTVQSANKLVDSQRVFTLNGYQLRIEEFIYDTIHIFNIPENATKNNIKSIFGRFGEIDCVSDLELEDSTDDEDSTDEDVLSETAPLYHTYVEYETEDSAAAAIIHCKESPMRLLGNTLHVELERLRFKRNTRAKINNLQSNPFKSLNEGASLSAHRI